MLAMYSTMIQCYIFLLKVKLHRRRLLLVLSVKEEWKFGLPRVRSSLRVIARNSKICCVELLEDPERGCIMLGQFFCGQDGEKVL